MWDALVSDNRGSSFVDALPGSELGSFRSRVNIVTGDVEPSSGLPMKTIWASHTAKLAPTAWRVYAVLVMALLFIAGQVNAA
jgi:hypothetical protein